MVVKIVKLISKLRNNDQERSGRGGAAELLRILNAGFY